MPISLQLGEEQSQRLEELARELNVDARELALAAIDELVARSAEDFERAAGHVLTKNRELYRRLA
ncbi:MAG: hypothetical protein RBS80_16135 [Thermoguttaceae bacterium]|jgi:predicted transcriptional regulator|nr:hypothetical protein [Thermoguttaceae bacterium]